MWSWFIFLNVRNIISNYCHVVLKFAYSLIWRLISSCLDEIAVTETLLIIMQGETFTRKCHCLDMLIFFKVIHSSVGYNHTRSVD